MKSVLTPAIAGQPSAISTVRPLPPPPPSAASRRRKRRRPTLRVPIYTRPRPARRSTAPRPSLPNTHEKGAL